MKFHSLMAVAVLLLAFDSGAVLLHPEAFPSLQNTAAVVSSGAAAPDEGGSAGTPASQAHPEPLSLSLLGVGFAVLGLTRRRGSQSGRLKQGLQRHLFPWPALCWLD